MGETKGTKEWAPQTYNFQTGCKNACEYCVDENTIILMADLTEKAIKDIKIGDSIIGIDKSTKQKRHYITSIVLNKWTTEQNAYLISLEDGTELICSGNHRWLTERGWKYTIGNMHHPNQRPYLTNNNSICKLYEVGNLYLGNFYIEESTQFKRGYLSGMIHGDGLLQKYDYSGKRRVSDIQYQFRLATRDQECLIRSKQYLFEFGIETSEIFKFQDNINAIRTHKKDHYHAIEELIRPVHNSTEWQRGFVSGFYDAEGNVDTSNVMRASNTELDLIQTYELGLRRFEFVFKREFRQFEDRKDLYVTRLTGGRAERIRFIQTFNPAIRRIRMSAIQGAINDKSKILNIRPLNKKLPMVDIETSTGNFIANGFVSHNCYARLIGDEKGWCPWNEWTTPKIRYKAVSKGWRPRKIQKKPHWIMFPSSHNIDRDNLNYASMILEKMLQAGIHVLIVMKPTPEIMSSLTDQFHRFSDRIEFRFTITTVKDRLRALFEPYASTIAQRLKSIEEAQWGDFSVSVSIEPFLDRDPTELIKTLINEAHVPEEGIWIGPMNHVTKLAQRSEIIQKNLPLLQEMYAPEHLYTIRQQIKGQGWNIHYKDGFMNKLKKYRSSRKRM